MNACSPRHVAPSRSKDGAVKVSRNEARTSSGRRAKKPHAAFKLTSAVSALPDGRTPSGCRLTSDESLSVNAGVAAATSILCLLFGRSASIRSSSMVAICASQVMCVGQLAVSQSTASGEVVAKEVRVWQSVPWVWEAARDQPPQPKFLEIDILFFAQRNFVPPPTTFNQTQQHNSHPLEPYNCRSRQFGL